MIDLHSHILPGLDDGVTTIDEAIAVINEAKEAGFTKIVTTTHYYNDKYVANESKRIKTLETLRKNVNQIEMLIGNEIFVNGYIDKLIKDKEASTLNNSKYILFEIPFINEYQDLKNLILNLTTLGYKLILAHPERYRIFNENPKKIEEILDLGVYLQANYLSILGFYGKEPQNLVQLLYKHNMISFVATDVHGTKMWYPNVKAAKNRIIKIIGEDNFKILSEKNPENVIENREIELLDYIPIQRNLLGKYK